MTVPTLRPSALQLALGALAVTAALSAAVPAQAIKLWERQKSTGAPAPAATPSAPAAEGSAPAAEGAAPAAEGSAPAAQATAPPSSTSQASANGAALAQRVASALPPMPGQAPDDPATFVRRQDHLAILLPLAAAARADAGRGQRLALAEALAARAYGPQAAQIYLSLLAEDPDLLAAWTNLGAVLRFEGQHELSVGVLDHALSLQPHEGLTWYQLGLTRQAQGDLPGADKAYLEALQADPTLWLPSHNPHVIVNDRAKVVLHDRYMKQTGASGPLAGGSNR